jgi:hypothetical protein
MESTVDGKQLEELKDIREDLGVIRESTKPRHAFMRGIFQGVGIVIGSILAITLLGWILGVLGFIPGFDSLEQSLKSAVDAYEHQ